MQYGRYGIEFDEQERPLFRRWAWLAWLIPVAALPLVLFRGGCSAPGRKPELPEPAGRYEGAAAPEAAEAGRPGLFGGLFGSGGKTAGAAAGAARPAASAAIAPAPDAPPPPPPPPPKPAKPKSEAYRKLLAAAGERERADDLTGARAALRELLALPEARDEREGIERKLAAVNLTLLLSDRPMPEKILHTIARGDMISRLALQYRNPQRFILKVNGIDNPSRLKIGQELWLMNEPDFAMHVSTNRCDALLTLNGQFFKRYAVGIGADAAPGVYTVRGRAEHPVYRRPGRKTVPYGAKGNILGVWRIQLAPAGRDDGAAGGMSLHGTWAASSIGSRQGDGHIRFSNADISELALILPNGARVVVKE